MLPTDSRTTPAGALAGVAALAVGVAWVLLAHGLWAGASRRGWGDLEAGGRFGTALLVHLPFLVLGFAVVVPVVAGLFGRSDGVAGGTVSAVLVAVPAVLLLRLDGLLLAQPQLRRDAVGSLVLTSLALALLGSSWWCRSDAVPAP